MNCFALIFLLKSYQASDSLVWMSGGTELHSLTLPAVLRQAGGGEGGHAEVEGGGGGTEEEEGRGCESPSILNQDFFIYFLSRPASK